MIPMHTNSSVRLGWHAIQQHAPATVSEDGHAVVRRDHVVHVLLGTVDNATHRATQQQAQHSRAASKRA